MHNILARAEVGRSYCSRVATSTGIGLEHLHGLVFSKCAGTAEAGLLAFVSMSFVLSFAYRHEILCIVTSALKHG